MSDLSANFNIDYPGAIPPGAWAQFSGSLPGQYQATYDQTKPLAAGPSSTLTTTNVPGYQSTAFSDAFAMPTQTMKSSNYAGSLSFSPLSMTKGDDGGWATTGGFAFDLPLSTVAAFQNNAMTFTAANAQMNRGFLDSVIGTQTAAVQNTAALASGLSTQALGASYGIAQMNTNAIKHIADNSLSYARYAQEQTTERTRIQTEGADSGGGCFFTTAVCEHWGMTDDCDILQTMREFRDGVMKADPALAPMVDEYYNRAPEIVAKINARPDAAQVWEYVGNAYILPGVNLCKIGCNKIALKTYKQLCAYLARVAGE